MKKFFLPFLFTICIFSNSMGQLKKSTIILTGTASYSHLKDGYEGLSGDDNQNLGLGTSAGYFITDRLAFGIIARYSHANITSFNNSDNYDSKSTTHGYNLGGFVRYYAPISEKFAFFGQGNLTFGNSKNNVTTSNTNTGILTTSEVTTNTNNYTAQLAPGFTFFPTSKIGIEFTFGSLAYTHNKSNYNNGSPNYKSNYLNMGFNLQSFNLGLSFYL